MNLQELFVPSTSLLELFVRGTLSYFFLLIIFTFSRREGGEIGISDILLVVLIVDAMQNGIANNYTSITEGLFLGATIFSWSYFINWLSYHSKFFESLTRPLPLPLIKDGNVIRKNLRRELITDDELQAQLRLQGVDDISKVARCYLEADGKISITPPANK
jgi:uncharacterized membrane protein YcaP (DUF421 family)